MFKFILSFLFLIEIYLFFAFKAVFEGSLYKLVLFIQISVLLFTLFSIFYTYNSLGHGLSKPSKTSNILIGLIVTFSVAKLFFVFFLLIEDIYRILSYLFGLISKPSSSSYLPSRRKAITVIGLGVASIPFVSFLYGMFKTRYDFKVFKEDLKFKDLPNEFEGVKIVQFSDFHAGSFDNFEAIKIGIETIQNLKPDLILFTGDLVNNLASEFDEFIPLLRKLEAPMGKYSILGNHDYGLYYNFKSEDEKRVNHDKIKQHHESIGFQLLLNEHITISKSDAEINLVGVENWGRPPFPSKGDLEKAMEKVKDENKFNILLSHDPHHWEDKVIDFSKHIHLTLSGHTHGMQMGIELPGFQWSPVSLRYKNWAGLYKEKEKYLYVNRGFGHIGFPGRVGIYPEITQITLSKK